MDLDSDIVLHLSAQIVSAHISNNPVPTEALPALISLVHRALTTVKDGPAVEEPRTPAVAVKSSVTNDHIACLECGKRFAMIKRHLRTEHDLSVEEYKQRWRLPHDYPITAPGYSAVRSDLAKQIGLGHFDGPGRKRKAGRPRGSRRVA